MCHILSCFFLFSLRGTFGSDQSYYFSNCFCLLAMPFRFASVLRVNFKASEKRMDNYAEYMESENLTDRCIWAASWQNQQNDCTPSEDSDQPGHPSSLIRVFAVHSVGSWGPNVSSCGHERLWSDWANALGAHPFCWFWQEAALFCVLVCVYSIKKDMFFLY